MVYEFKSLSESIHRYTIHLA